MLLTNALWYRLWISVLQKQTKHPTHIGENKRTHTYAMYTFTCMCTIYTNVFKRKLLHEWDILLYSYLRDEKAKIQKDYVLITCPRSHSWYVVEPDFNVSYDSHSNLEIICIVLLSPFSQMRKLTLQKENVTCFVSKTHS